MVTAPTKDPLWKAVRRAVSPSFSSSRIRHDQQMSIFFLEQNCCCNDRPFLHGKQGHGWILECPVVVWVHDQIAVIR